MKKQFNGDIEIQGKAVIDMSFDTMFVLEQVQDYLEGIIAEKQTSVARAEELIELIHIKKEIILYEEQQKALTIIAKEQCKKAAEMKKDSYFMTETERYFIEAAEANEKAFFNRQQLDRLRQCEFEKIVGILQRRQQEMEAEGEKEVCS